LLKFVASRQSFFQVPSLTFHETPSTGNPAETRGRPDGWLDGWMDAYACNEAKSHIWLFMRTCLKIKLWIWHTRIYL